MMWADLRGEIAEMFAPLAVPMVVDEFGALLYGVTVLTPSHVWRSNLSEDERRHERAEKLRSYHRTKRARTNKCGLCGRKGHRVDTCREDRAAVHARARALRAKGMTIKDIATELNTYRKAVRKMLEAS